MTPISTVYKLQTELDDPRFDGFIFGPEASSVLGLEDVIDDFHVKDPESLDWQPRSLKADWKPQPVVGPVKAFNDFPCLELTTPVFSRRAVDALGNLLTDNGEVLPLQSDVGEYYIFNVLTKLDALDLGRSRLSRRRPDKTAVFIDYFAFDPSRLTNTAIFRVPEHPYFILVSQQFKERAERAGLNGFNFVKVWPLPEGVEWRQEEAARCRKRRAVKLTGEALVLRFPLESAEASTRETDFAADIEQSLAAKLKVETLEEHYWGSIDLMEFQDGEFRIACTCPNCDELAEHLAEWFQDIRWDTEVTVVKRYGNLYAPKAKEKRFTIPKSE